MRKIVRNTLVSGLLSIVLTGCEGSNENPAPSESTVQGIVIGEGHVDNDYAFTIKTAEGNLVTFEASRAYNAAIDSLVDKGDEVKVSKLVAARGDYYGSIDYNQIKVLSKEGNTDKIKVEN